MLRLTYDDDSGRKHLGLGVSRENINRLTAGKPILVKLPELKQGLSIDGSVCIFFAETEAELMQMMSEFIGPDTKVHIDPRMKSKTT